MADLVLADGFAFADLYSVDGLGASRRRLPRRPRTRDRPDLAKRLKVSPPRCGLRGLPGYRRAQTTAARDRPTEPNKEEDYSALLIDLAPYFEDFVGRLFGIEAELRALAARHSELAPIYTVKRQFVQRRAGKQVKPADALALDGDASAGPAWTTSARRRTTSWPLPATGQSPGSTRRPGSRRRAGGRPRLCGLGRSTIPKGRRAIPAACCSSSPARSIP